MPCALAAFHITRASKKTPTCTQSVKVICWAEAVGSRGIRAGSFDHDALHVADILADESSCLERCHRTAPEEHRHARIDRPSSCALPG